GHPAPHPTLWSFPRVDVTAPFPEVLDTRSFEFAAFLTDSYGVAEVRVEQDGRALEEKDVHAACVFDTDAKRVHVTLKCAVPAPADRTSLCISARNIRNVWSPKTRVDLHYVAPTRTLYLLAMGVAKYDDHRLDLNCPVNDVDEIVAAFERQKGLQYGEVLARKLVQGEVTIAHARQLLDEFLVKAQKDDTIVVFAAGHGV